MTQTADFDHNIFSAGNAETDKSTLARFLMRSVQDQAASDEEGRPVFKEVEFIEIRIAGNRTDYVCRRATWKDKERFPRHYEAFKKRIEQPEDGTPLTEWAQITRSQAEELAFFHIKTVEQLVACSDAAGQQLMGFHALKAKAKKYIDGAKESVDNQTLRDELADRDNRIEELEKRVNALVHLPDDKQLELPLDEPQPLPMTTSRRRKK